MLNHEGEDLSVLKNLKRCLASAMFIRHVHLVFNE